MTSAIVRRLSEVGSADKPSVGGKAAGLGELTHAGIPVPPGFVVLAEAFGQAMDVLDRSGSLVRSVASLSSSDVSAIARVAAGVRERITALPLPGDVVAQITTAYEALSRDGAAGATSSMSGADRDCEAWVQPSGVRRKTSRNRVVCRSSSS